MIKNYLLLAFRSIWNNKVYSFINIFGFGVGMAACMMIILWIRDETSFDRFHTKSSQIYRILAGEKGHMQPRTPHPLGQQMVAEFPEVEQAVSMSPLWGPGLTLADFSVRYQNIIHDEMGIFSVDTPFFKIFDFPFLAGNPNTALKEPGCLILTRETAEKYFGSVDQALGKTLRINNQLDATVNGVIENVPQNSHFTFDFLISYVTMKQLDRAMHKGELSDYYTWNDFGHYNYLLIKPDADVKALEKKLNDWVLVQNFIPLNEQQKQMFREGRYGFELQAMNKIHLHSHVMWELGTNGNILYIYIFFTAALLILIVACINFMNLSTARSLKRAKEVGIRKAIGVYRPQLIAQYLTESFLLTFLSLLVALLLCHLFLPGFNQFTGKVLSLHTLLLPEIIWKVALAVILVGLVSGSYPAFFLSSFVPYEVLKGTVKFGGSQLTIRKFLVIFQFVISILLILCTFVIYKQIHYLQSRNLGFNPEQVVVVTMKDDRVRSSYDVIRTTLLHNPSILKVAAASSIPGGQFNQNGIRYEGNNVENFVAETFVTSDYFDLLQIKTADGRIFSDDFRGDTTASFVINEAAAKLYDWDTPIDKTIIYNGDIYTNARGKIIGVVRDFNIHSLQQKVAPLIILLGRKTYFTYMLIRISPREIPKTLAFIENTWKRFDTQHDYTFHFLDDLFSSQYQGERSMGTIFWVFTLLAVFVAVLGLFGLSSFVIEQRTKEIGIRKAHGASVLSILLLLSGEFATWVLIASLIAFPLGYFVARNWLQNFAYHTTLGVVIFLFTLLIALSVMLITIGYQAWNSARTNPVDSLKHE